MASLCTRLTHHQDAQLERLNTFALMLALNQILYAPSLMLLAGPEGARAWPVAFSAPAFAATPWIARRSSLAARLWVPFIGVANSMLASACMGYDSGAWVFVAPSLTLAALLLRQRERWYLAGLTGFAMAVFFTANGPGLSTPAICIAISRINAGSAIILTGFVGWLFSDSKPERH